MTAWGRPLGTLATKTARWATTWLQWSSVPGKASSISVGFSHACALLDDLSIACWGHNGQGQRDGTNNDVDTTAEMGAGLGRLTCRQPGHPPSRKLVLLMRDNPGRTVRCWGENSDGRLGVYDSVDDDIGDQSGEMGGEMQMTNLYGPPDFDGDGWMTSGTLTTTTTGTWTDDDLPFDERDWFDHDGDGLGSTWTLTTTTVRQTAEEDTTEKWSDAEEEACGTLWWSSLSSPTTTTGTGYATRQRRR